MRKRSNMDKLRYATIICLKSACIAVLLAILWASVAHASPYEQRLADAIFKAENSKDHPYGIMVKYKHTTPRQACLNTIRSAQKRFQAQTKEKDFIILLSKTYAPIGASNDPKGLNRNWIRNVKHFLNERKDK